MRGLSFFFLVTLYIPYDSDCFNDFHLDKIQRITLKEAFTAGNLGENGYIRLVTKLLCQAKAVCFART